MLREAFSALDIHGIVNRNADQWGSMGDELAIALASLWTDPAKTSPPSTRRPWTRGASL